MRVCKKTDQGRQGAGDQFHKAPVADEPGKFAAEVDLHVLEIEGLEIPAVRRVEEDQNGHDFAQVQGALAVASAYPVGCQPGSNSWANLSKS